MFRVNAREWINPKTVGIYHVEIEDENNMGDKAYCVRIETENDEYYLSDVFPTFEEAERYVKDLIDKQN